jgi:hypothetical protein
MKIDDNAPLPGFVSGEWIAALAGGLPPDVEELGARILQKHGLDNVAPGEWYPMDSFLSAMAEIAEEFGRMAEAARNPQAQESTGKCACYVGSSYLH